MRDDCFNSITYNHTSWRYALSTLITETKKIRTRKTQILRSFIICSNQVTRLCGGRLNVRFWQAIMTITCLTIGRLHSLTRFIECMLCYWPFFSTACQSMHCWIVRCCCALIGLLPFATPQQPHSRYTTATIGATQPSHSSQNRRRT